jgi:hypothetical protein
MKGAAVEEPFSSNLWKSNKGMERAARCVGQSRRGSPGFQAAQPAAGADWAEQAACEVGWARQRAFGRRWRAWVAQRLSRRSLGAHLKEAVSGGKDERVGVSDDPDRV